MFSQPTRLYRQARVVSVLVKNNQFQHDAEESCVCWSGPTLRAAAKTEGLRIRQSRHTAVRKRTASAMTPCSASANACVTTPGVSLSGKGRCPSQSSD